MQPKPRVCSCSHLFALLSLQLHGTNRLMMHHACLRVRMCTSCLEMSCTLHMLAGKECSQGTGRELLLPGSLLQAKKNQMFPLTPHHAVIP